MQTNRQALRGGDYNSGGGDFDTTTFHTFDAYNNNNNNASVYKNDKLVEMGKLKKIKHLTLLFFLCDKALAAIIYSSTPANRQAVVSSINRGHQRMHQ